jgi:NitT/TauT family transport system substrate-binding protein
MRRVRWRTFAMLVVLAAGGARAQQSAVTIATPSAVPAVSSYLARDRGYFRDAGVDVQVEKIDSLSRVMALVATNKIQVAQGAINAGLFNAVAQGLPVVMVLSSGSTPVYHNLVLRRDLAGAIKTPTDLKGRTIAVSGAGSGSVYEVASVLEGVGLRLADVKIKPLSFQQMTASLASGAIDAALMYSPASDFAIEKGIAVPWIDPEKGYLKVLPVTGLTFVASLDWIRQDRDVALKVVTALMRGGRDYCQAYHHGPDRSEVIDAMLRNGIGRDKAQLDAMKWQARDPDGAYNRASVLDQQRIFKKEGFLQKEASYERLIDTSLAEEAARQLGPFKLANPASPLEGCR